MKLVLSSGILVLALSFCNLYDVLKSAAPDPPSSTSSNSQGSTSSTGTAEKPALTPAQQSITEAAVDVKWDAQGIAWRLPPNWKKMSVMKESLNYGSPDN